MRRSTARAEGATGAGAVRSGDGGHSPRRSVSTSKSQSRGADKAAVLRRERASWLGGPDGLTGGNRSRSSGGLGGGGPRSGAENTTARAQPGGSRPDGRPAGATAWRATSAVDEDDDQESELMGEFAEKLRMASEAELKHRDMMMQQEMDELRVSICLSLSSLFLSVCVCVYVCVRAC